jgi:hypothetical protein
VPEIAYPKIRYQGVPRTPLESHVQNPGFIYVRVNTPDDERALEGDWSDSPADAVKGVAKDTKITPGQYELLSQQAVLRGAVAPPAPKFDDAPAKSAHHSGSPSDPAAEIDPSEKPRPQGEWPRESARKR